MRANSPLASTGREVFPYEVRERVIAFGWPIVTVVCPARPRPGGRHQILKFVLLVAQRLFLSWLGGPRRNGLLDAPGEFCLSHKVFISATEF
jgi:hypothetical protein